MKKYTWVCLSGMIILILVPPINVEVFRFLFIFLGTSLAFCYWGLHWSSAELRIKHLKSHVRVRLRLITLGEI